MEVALKLLQGQVAGHVRLTTEDPEKVVKTLCLNGPCLIIWPDKFMLTDANTRHVAGTVDEIVKALL